MISPNKFRLHYFDCWCSFSFLLKRRFASPRVNSRIGGNRFELLLRVFSIIFCLEISS